MTTAKPPSPPPAYTEVDSSQFSSSSSPRPQLPVALPSQHAASHHHGRQHHAHHHALNTPPVFPVHPHYGPTPIGVPQRTPILPYYDPRSQFAIEEADSRARWRFLGALCWAFVILTIFSALCQIEVDIQRKPWRGWWFGSGNSDPWMDQ